MKISTFEFLPNNVRISLSENFRRKIFSDKEETMRRLKISRNTVNCWIRGEYKPSRNQIENLLGFLPDDEILEIGLEGGKTINIPKLITAKELGWIIGIIDGDSAGKRDGIGITNQDLDLVKTFLDLSCRLFGIKRKSFKLYVTWYTRKPLDKIADFLDVDNNQIKHFNPSKNMYKINSPIVQAIFYSRILKKFLINVRANFSRDFEEFAWYVRGLADSDGTFARTNVVISQNLGNHRNMEVAKRILNSLEIKNGGIRGPDSKNMLRINIFSEKENLRRYRDFIGFYSKSKQERLNSLIN